jgi:Predicted membrane protein
MDVVRPILWSIHLWFFASLLSFVAFRLHRALGGRGFRRRQGEEALAQLDLRFAKGELSESEYRRHKELLREDRRHES